MSARGDGSGDTPSALAAAEGTGAGAGVTLRPPLPADLEALASIERECFPQPWNAAQLASALGAEGAVAIFAADGERTVGYALYRRAADEAELLRVAVLPSHRRAGLGRRLLLAGEASLRTAGCAAAFLEVHERNEGALRLYAAAGWERVGRRPGYYPDGAAALLLRRALT